MCKIVVTNNSLTSFCSCRRQYDYKVNRGILPVETSKCYDNASALSKAVTSVIVSFSEKVSKDEAIDRGVSVIRDCGLEPAGEAQCEATLKKYVEKYYNENNDAWTVVEGSVGACVELNVSPNVIYKTYLNAVVQNNGKSYVVINKSSSMSITDDFFNKFYIDTDVRMQVLAAKQQFGIDVDGVIVNAMTRPQHKIKVGETDAEYAERNAARKGKADLKRKMGETREEYVQRMMDDYPEDSLRKVTILFDDAKLNMALSNVLAIAGDLMSCKSFYPNTSECTKNGKCPYMSLCRNDGDVSKCSELYTVK